jgi:hypothetical protein
MGEKISYHKMHISCNAQNRRLNSTGRRNVFSILVTWPWIVISWWTHFANHSKRVDIFHWHSSLCIFYLSQQFQMIFVSHIFSQVGFPQKLLNCCFSTCVHTVLDKMQNKTVVSLTSVFSALDQGLPLHSFDHLSRWTQGYAQPLTWPHFISYFWQTQMQK